MYLSEKETARLRLLLDGIQRQGGRIQELTGFGELEGREKELHNHGVNVSASVLIINKEVFHEEF